MFTLEQLQAILGAGDITEQEKQRQQLLDLGVNLRNQMPNIHGRGVWSNIGRAGYGIGGAINSYRGMGMSPEITRAKQDLYARILRGMGQQTPQAEQIQEMGY